MAEMALLRRRYSSLRPLGHSLFSSFFFQSSSLYCTSTTIISKQAQCPTEKKGKWLTLPPFTSSISPSQLGQRIASPSQNLKVEPVTALKWVLQCCPSLPRSLVQKLFRLRQVRREPGGSNSATCLEKQSQQRRPRRVTAKDTMNSGDQISLPISVQELPPEVKHVLCTEDEIKFLQCLELHKDPAILVVNKPAGLPVQGGIGIRRSLDALAATALRYEYAEPPRLVHRLDRDSSGILVMGRTQASATLLHSIFREKTVRASDNDVDSTKRILQRRYLALVIGIPRHARGLISAALKKVVLDNGRSDRITTVDDPQFESAQVAITEYNVIKSSCHGFAWLELYPLTGRKHQLRVHCAEVLGTPILGDYKYGSVAHRKWKPIAFQGNSEPETETLSKHKLPFGLHLVGGSIAEKCPSLHLHCRQMVIPNVAEALNQLHSSPDWNLSKLPKIDLVAPLPSHMRRSWDILNCE